MVAIVMRQACAGCSATEGRIETRNGQDCVFCAGCGRFCYNAPKAETGRAVRPTSRTSIKPSKRARILARDGWRCIVCGQRDDLDIGHLLSVADAAAVGAAELVDTDDNLATMCRECNLGIGRRSVEPRLVAMVLRARPQGPAY